MFVDGALVGVLNVLGEDGYHGPYGSRRSRPIRDDGRRSHGACSLGEDAHRSSLEDLEQGCCSNDLEVLFPPCY